jgi:hypothetical protein
MRVSDWARAVVCGLLCRVPGGGGEILGAARLAGDVDDLVCLRGGSFLT